MKKGILILVGLLFTLPTMAESVDRSGQGYGRGGKCVVELQGRRGRTIEVFRDRECREAKRDCRHYQRRNSRRYPYAECVVVRRPAKPRPPRKDHVIDEVHFYNKSTGKAIRSCKAARERDNRCTSDRRYSCSPCSEIAHSDHSSYIVYGSRRTDRRRTFINTFHFTDRKTAVARQKCEVARQRMRECSMPRRYECTPCTVESHTDHSEFSLYSL